VIRKGESMLDKIKGGLFGVAIGDALGGTTEFMTEAEIKRKHGRLTSIIGGGVWELEPGQITDDTAMTVAVAKGILQNPDNPIQAIGNEFLKWFNSRPKDVGITIRSVLSQYDGDWFATSQLVRMQLHGKAGGNGSLMRTLPVALAYPSLEKMLEITNQQSRMTHYDDTASNVCQIYNRIARRILHNEPLKEAIEVEVEGTKFASALSHKPEVPADGYVVHTFLWVIYYLYHLGDFREIAIAAANKGNDSDTIGAIACGLKGLEIGFERLPDDYKNQIIIKDELTQIAEGLFRLRQTLKSGVE
jgi:ADP-ribosyl-[dinitrogen reductase] hydrolase